MFMVMVRFTACTGAIERRRLNHRHHRSSRSGWGSEERERRRSIGPETIHVEVIE